MTPRVIALLLLVPVVHTAGCGPKIQGGTTHHEAATVTFDELKALTADKPFFLWIGDDDSFHYFVIDESRHYRLPSDFPMPAFREIRDRMIDNNVEIGELEWFATIDGDTIRVPDDEVLQAWLHSS